MILKDYCGLIVDCEHKTAPTEREGYPSIRTPNIGRGRFILESVNRVSQETYEEWTRRAIPHDSDLILAREAPIGNVAIIKSGQKFCLGQRTVLIRPNKTKVNPDYLMYVLLSPPIQGLIRAKANGVTVDHLNMHDIRNLELPEFADRENQDKIAGILSVYDSLVEVNQSRIKILEQLAKLIYDEWFVKFRFPGHEHVKMRESEYGKIPEDWRILNIGDNQVSEQIFSGGTPDTRIPEYWNGEIPWLSSGETRDNYILGTEKRITKSGVENSSTHLAKIGDVVIASAGQGDTRGQVSLLMIDTYINQSIIAIRTNKRNMNPFYLYANLVSRYNELRGISDSNSSRGSLTTKLISSLPILVPSPEVMMPFNALADPIYHQAATLRRKNLNLSQTRDLLLPKLVSRDIDVSDLRIKTEGSEV